MGNLNSDKRKIRVLHVTNSLNYGGLERVVIDICRYLDPAEFEPMVACIRWAGPQAKLLRDVGVQIIMLKKSWSVLYKNVTLFNLKKVIRSNKIDVVHTHNTGPLLDAIAARLTSICFPKIIHTDHTRASWPDKKKYMIFERIASKLVYSMIAVSEEAKEKLVRFEHIPQNRIGIIDNGIAVENFHQPNERANEVKQELKIDQFKFIIGLCVVLRKQKGIEHLLHALPYIIKEYPEIVCVIGGGGPERESLETLASALNLQEHIRFIGPRDDVEKILQIFDVYVLPSEWEGLPLSILEAMAAQRCIVATAVGSVPKVLKYGECGILIPPKNPGAIIEAVINLLKSPELRADLAVEAYRCVNEKYSARVMAKNYGSLYKKSVG